MIRMQPIDPDDKRHPHVQIAASIRAAILTGELEPGSQLDTGQELAAFFGVSRMTVASAIRTLRDEGFVRSRMGSGVFVRDLASLPAPEGEEHPLAGTAMFLFEIGQLKHQPRSGWLLLGIPHPESVAEHSFRVGVIGLILAAMDGADVGRTAALGLMHDAHETRIGDVPSVGRAYVTTADPEAITAHQVAKMPDEASKAVQELTAEYEANVTREARLAHDADKIETLLQATEYQAQGHDTETWRENSVAALRTEPGQRLAQAIGAGDSRWWAPFNASYLELHASARNRTQASRPDEEG
jgi:5'-deoxynucleotidase YfbR-like HD superfamily hydrolase/DNA-binding transcriptional regulator YhcF (GntR family)